LGLLRCAQVLLLVVGVELVVRGLRGVAEVVELDLGQGGVALQGLQSRLGAPTPSGDHGEASTAYRSRQAQAVGRQHPVTSLALLRRQSGHPSWRLASMRSRRHPPVRPAGTSSATAGTSTRPTSRSEAPGGTCSGPSTSSARSSTCSSHLDGTWKLLDGSSIRRGRRLGSHPSRSRPTGTASTPASSRSWIRRLLHRTEAHANNSLETDHGRLKARPRPMRGLKRDRTARVIVKGHAFIQNLRRGFYDLGTEVPSSLRVADAFAELALAI
jgi:hypothetical protein